MKPEDQVASLEFSRKLYDLGWRLDTHFYWYEQVGGIVCDRECVGEWIIRTHEDVGVKGFGKYIPAPTVAELLEVLPKAYPGVKHSELILYCHSGTLSYVAVYEDIDNNMVNNSDSHGDTLANALAAMLIFLTEKGIVKP